MIALIAAIGFGVAAGALVGAIVTGDPLYTVTASIAFPVAVMVAVFGGIGSVARGRRRAASAQAHHAGELALARVERIARTGPSADGRPQFELVLTVAPPRRRAYSTVHREIAEIVELADLQPGSIIVVRRPDDARADVVLELDAPEDWARLRDAERLRTGSDRTVPLASGAAAWASEPATPAREPRSPARAWRWVLPAAVFVATAALVLVPAYDSIARTAQALASGHPESAGVVLGDRHQEIVDALAREAGGTQFVRIGFYDGYAIAAAPSAPGALTIDEYQYRWDRAEHLGPELIQPDDPAGALFDAGDVDFSRIPEHIATAREQSGIDDPDSVIVLVDRSGIADDAGASPVRVMVLLDSPYEDATVSFDAASGELLG